MKHRVGVLWMTWTELPLLNLMTTTSTSKHTAGIDGYIGGQHRHPRQNRTKRSVHLKISREECLQAKKSIQERINSFIKKQPKSLLNSHGQILQENTGSNKIARQVRGWHEDYLQ
jgi:hypothetical protein